jgi:hypothetical protein
MVKRRWLASALTEKHFGDRLQISAIRRCQMLRIGKYLVSTIIILMLVAYGAGCSAAQVTDYASLVDNLDKAGATVEPAGEVTQPFFSVQGRVITVNGGDVQVFEYENAATAETEASYTTDGIHFAIKEDSITRALVVDWVAPPHFYKAGKLIVLYVGDSESVIDALDGALGSQFAGQ